MADATASVSEATPDIDETPETSEQDTPGELIRLDIPEASLTTLSVQKRRIGLRIVPFGEVAEHPAYGPLLFEPGAFDPVVPRDIRLRMDHDDPPTGLGNEYAERDGFAHMEFGISKTQRGEDQLALVADGVSRGASVGFIDLGKARLQTRGGQRVRVFGPGSARLTEVSTTWRPTFQSAGVTYVLSKEGTPVTETAAPEAPAPVISNIQEAGPGVITTLLERLISSSDDRQRELVAKLETTLSGLTDAQGRLEESFGELARKNFNVPVGENQPKAQLHHWVEVTLRRMAGEHISPTELKELALDDVITTEQPGLVPSVFTADYDDLINSDRPFLQSTRNIVPPRTGTTMTLPIITSRAVAGTQAGNAEKGALTTTATKVGTGSFAYVSVFGGADISIQMINRADPSFFDLLTGDIAMAYALDAEAKGIAALLAGYTDSASVAHAPDNGGTIDPENLTLGAAWQNSIAVYKRAPDTMWMNAAAVSAFIDAKATDSNQPLYSNLAAAFTAGGGPGGTLSGLRPVYVPALDDEDVDVIVGPSRGFVWAEDPARRLQADNPANAGRDFVLAGGIFPAPRYADAFTVYTIAGGS